METCFCSYFSSVFCLIAWCRCLCWCSVSCPAGTAAALVRSVLMYLLLRVFYVLLTDKEHWSCRWFIVLRCTHVQEWETQVLHRRSKGTAGRAGITYYLGALAPKNCATFLNIKCRDCIWFLLILRIKWMNLQLSNCWYLTCISKYSGAHRVLTNEM